MKRKVRKIRRIIRIIRRRMQKLSFPKKVKRVVRKVRELILTIMQIAGFFGVLIGGSSDWDRSDPKVLTILLLGSLGLLFIALVMDKKIALPSR